MSQEHTQFRRCHVCGATNESNVTDHISKCKGCGRALAPFYYFDLREVCGIAVDHHIGQLQQDLSVVSDGSQNEEAPAKYKPLQGLALVW